MSHKNHRRSRNPRPTLVIARLTFREAARRKILLGAVLLGIVFLGVYGAGLYFMHQDLERTGQMHKTLVVDQIYNFMTLAGLYVVNFLFAMMCVLTSVDTIAGEITSGTIQALAAKPVRRSTILLGKWIGYVVMLSIYFLLMAGGTVLVLKTVIGYDVPNVWRGLALIWLNGIMLLNVTLLGGTQLSALANGVLVFAAFGVAFVGGWVEQIGSFVQSQAAINVGVVSSLLLPSEALWKRAAYEMRSLLVDAVGFSPFVSASSVPSTAMLIYAALYAIVALVLAVWNFSRRDL